MQTLGWYARRLARMSPLEAAQRAGHAVRNATDRWRLPTLQRRVSERLARGSARFTPGFEVTDVPVAGWAHPRTRDVEDRWVEALLAHAEDAAAGRLTIFNLERWDLGNPIDWNRDHGSGRAAPLRPSASIDYRDFRVTGDAKLVWEPNRHHHLVVLGRAYRASGERKYAAAAVAPIESWMDQCPFGMGMNWRSPLELAVRLINWTWAVDLVRPSGLVSNRFLTRLLESVYLHLWEITRKYSRGSSANNHLVGEAAGVFIASRYFDAFSESPRWAARAAEILNREILAQTHPDGGTREQALGYHQFVMQFFTIAGVVGRKTALEFPRSYWERLERMYEFAAAFLEGGTRAPMFGDSDDGYVLDLGRGEGDLRAWLPVGAILFQRSDFKAAASGYYSQCARWLLGQEGWKEYERLRPKAEGRLTSRAFPNTGLYLLQSGRADSPDAVSVVFDCAELGMGSLAAHGHADALSIAVRAFGTDILIDPGTYDYFSHPAWRNYFRSTRAHSTLEIDGQDQSVMTGPFMWGRRANARCLDWEANEHGGKVSGEHDGYRRLSDPVCHRRHVELHGAQREILVRDEVEAAGEHLVRLYFHFAEHCTIEHDGGSKLLVECRGGHLLLELDPLLELRIARGSTAPILGWVSRGYHRKAPACAVVGTARIRGRACLTTRLRLSRPVAEASLEAVQALETVREVVQ